MARRSLVVKVIVMPLCLCFAEFGGSMPSSKPLCDPTSVKIFIQSASAPPLFRVVLASNTSELIFSDYSTLTRKSTISTYFNGVVRIIKK